MRDSYASRLRVFLPGAPARCRAKSAVAKARKEGTLTLEADIDDPQKSPIFTQYPKILADHHIVEFLTDYLRLMVGGDRTGPARVR